MKTISPQGIGAVSPMSEGTARIPRENRILMNTRPDEIVYEYIRIWIHLLLRIRTLTDIYGCIRTLTDIFTYIDVHLWIYTLADIHRHPQERVTYTAMLLDDDTYVHIFIHTYMYVHLWIYSDIYVYITCCTNMLRSGRRT